uniref:coproporphyrinogen oxidase n=2 Tax=Eukaryota TaxID=2759 RepID=X5CWZ4_9EUKA|mmetsp:Transcript_12540/g.16063  ORF Transcript_12540/g.16063 Transcript_12540/m.16063 type:complete len:382 (-) Transcript_12540:543-1688(-)
MLALALGVACTSFLAAGSLGGSAPSVVHRPRASVLLAESATTDEQKASGISWDSHEYVNEAPESLVRDDDLPNANMEMRRKFEENCRRAQNAICNAVSELDGKPFTEDIWTRSGGGGGISRVLCNGNVFEKAGCSLSVVYGSMPQDALQSATSRGADRAKGYKEGERVPFFACGLSSVMHPRNPMAPTMHFNYRYFETDGGVWWFGGGSDITPAYLFEEDIQHFHQTYKDICDKHDPEYYPKFKKWADEYFTIKHRGETRGLGGIFFDDHNDREPDEIFAFSKECLDAIIPAYLPIVAKHKDDEFTQKQKEWQLMRRGRYVEFNLVYDRGTVFGLKTGGRIESILMSLPETARWEYNHQPEEGSPEAEIMDAFKNPREWAK